MIFLVNYDRRSGDRIITAFADDERELAQQARLELELELHRSGVEREVVLLDAADETALRRTHGRYFEDLSQRAETPK